MYYQLSFRLSNRNTRIVFLKNITFASLELNPNIIGEISFIKLKSFQMSNFGPIARTGKKIKEARLLKLTNSNKVANRSARNLQR